MFLNLFIGTFKCKHIMMLIFLEMGSEGGCTSLGLRVTHDVLSSLNSVVLTKVLKYIA